MTYSATMETRRPSNLSLGNEARGSLAIGSLAAHAVSAATRIVRGEELTDTDRHELETIATLFETAATAVEAADDPTTSPETFAGSVAALQAIEFEMGALAAIPRDASIAFAEILREYAAKTRALLADGQPELAEQAISIFTQLSNVALSRLGSSGETTPGL
jgi:MoxR-like ATPase